MLDFTQDAIDVFLNEDEFAEWIVYKPTQGMPRSILAVVERDAPDAVNETQRTVSDFVAVNVANHQTKGIASCEQNLTDGKIELAPRKGGPVKDMTILKVIGEHDGMLRLELR